MTKASDKLTPNERGMVNVARSDSRAHDVPRLLAIIDRLCPPAAGDPSDADVAAMLMSGDANQVMKAVHLLRARGGDGHE